MFLSIIWEFCRLYFDHIIPLPPTPPRSSQHPYSLNFMFSLLVSPLSTPPMESNSYWPTTPGCGARPGAWYTASVTPLKKTDFPSLGSNQMPISPQLGVGFHAHLPSSMLGFCLSWTCAILVHAVALHDLTGTSALFRLENIIPLSHLQPLALVIILKPFFWDGLEAMRGGGWKWHLI